MAPDISIPMTPSPQVVHDCNSLATATGMLRGGLGPVHAPPAAIHSWDNTSL